MGRACAGDATKPDWTRLETLSTLACNGSFKLRADIAQLVAVVPPTLTNLDLTGARGITGDAGKAEWSRLPVLEMLELRGSSVVGDLAELVSKLPPSIKKMPVHGTRLTGEFKSADWARLPSLDRYSTLIPLSHSIEGFSVARTRYNPQYNPQLN